MTGFYMDRPLAIVLGGTLPHVTLVERLHARGYGVLLVDYLDDPPAKRVADEHVQISTLDKEAVLSLAKERGAVLVISACIDQANSVCCYVAERLGLPHPYSYDTSLAVTEKGRMKTAFVKNGIPTAAYQEVSSVEEVDWSRVPYPAVVKPVDCNSSKGVRCVSNAGEAKVRLAEALALSRAGKAIIEEFNVGDEIQVDCVATADGVKVMMTRLKRKVAADGDAFVLQSWGSVFPAPLDGALKAKVTEVAKRIAAAFGLRNTPFFYQATVVDGDIRVIEFAPRVGGGMSSRILLESAGYDPVDCVVDSFLGREIRVSPVAQDRFRSTNILYMKAGVFGGIDGLDALLSEGTVSDCVVYRHSGDRVDGDLRSSNRVATLVIDGVTYDEVRHKSLRAIETVEIRDPSGAPMLNRELYRTFLNQ